MTSAEKTTEARRFVVRGRVQGVGFRWFVEREAHVLGIAGWVRNNFSAAREKLFSAATVKKTRRGCSSINPTYIVHEDYEFVKSTGPVA
jgi:hypothetical protein